MSQSERRVAPRIKSDMPLDTEYGKVMTRDLSSSGVYFETDGSFTPGQPIKYSIVLEYLYPEHPVCLMCEGKIVRVQKEGDKIGVAATIDSYSVVDRLP
jgi:hypothetical protein